MRVFGYVCLSTNNSAAKTKFDTKISYCVLICYPYGKKWYKLYEMFNLMQVITKWPIPNRIDIVGSKPKWVFMILKHIYKVKGSVYIYNPSNFPPIRYATLQTPCHANIASPLCLTGLWSQTNKYPSRGQTNPHIRVEDQL